MAKFFIMNLFETPKSRRTKDSALCGRVERKFKRNKRRGRRGAQYLGALSSGLPTLRLI